MGLLVEIAKTTQREMAGKTKVEDKSWSFREGIILFPETRCPFCKEVVRSKAIWHVDNKAKRLLGQGVPKKGEPFKLDNPKHPHVFTGSSGRGGGTCMGNAPDMMTALFSAYNPASLADTSQKISTWFRGKYWEHDCQKVGQCSRCHVECGARDERIYKSRTYCDQCWQYEAVPLKVADELKAKKAEEAKRAAEAKKKAPGQSQDQQGISLAALLGQPEAPREAPPEIPGFRFAGGGAGERIIVVPIADVEGPVRGMHPVCRNCGMRAFPITDCENHEGQCTRCHGDE